MFQVLRNGLVSQSCGLQFLEQSNMVMKLYKVSFLALQVTERNLNEQLEQAVNGVIW